MLPEYFNRYCIYKWLKIYEEKGYKGFNTIKLKGAVNIITPKIDNWIIVLMKTPIDFNYETHLWTSILQLLKKECDIDVCDDTVSFH